MPALTKACVFACLLSVATVASVTGVSQRLVEGAEAARRSEAHQSYAARLWNYLNDEKVSYGDWDAPASFALPGIGPATSVNDRLFANPAADRSTDHPKGAVIVRQHRTADGDLLAVTAYVKQETGYDSRSGDWYWIQFTPAGAVTKTSADKKGFDRHGFVTFVEDSRLWIFDESSAALREFVDKGEPAKHVTLPGAGPQGMTVKSDDRSVIDRYMATKPGFAIRLVDGRIWVFRPDSDALREFDQTGDMAKRVILPAAGPNQTTLCGADQEVLNDYLHEKPGFVTQVVDGRLWVFKADSAELEEFRSSGEPAKHVTHPGAGPKGLTVKGPDTETVLEYLTAAEGFHTKIVDGRLWVFHEDCPELDEFKSSGEPAKHVTLPGAGPLGLTVKGPDSETIDVYLRSRQG